jgi:hypothetical protein
MSLLCIATFGAYVAYNFQDIAHVSAIAIQGDHFSYGARILPAHLYHQVGADHWPGPRVIKQLIALVPLGAITAAVAVRARQHFVRRHGDWTGSTDALLALHVGALVYLGTFASANNFDYRLVFLLLTFPCLSGWARTPSHPLSTLASVTLVAVVALLWVGCMSEWLNLWDELVSWLVAGLLAAVLAASTPPIDTLWASIFGSAGTTDATV